MFWRNRNRKRTEWRDDHSTHKNDIWKKVDNENGGVYLFEGNELVGETPATVKSTEEAQYHFKVWKKLGEQQKKIKAKIKKLKEQVIASS